MKLGRTSKQLRALTEQCNLNSSPGDIQWRINATISKPRTNEVLYSMSKRYN